MAAICHFSLVRSRKKSAMVKKKREKNDYHERKTEKATVFYSMELLTTCSDVFGFRFPYYDDSANLCYHFPYVDNINFLSSLHTVLCLIQNKKLWPSSYRYRCQCATKAACQFILWTNDPASFYSLLPHFFFCQCKAHFCCHKNMAYTVRI